MVLENEMTVKVRLKSLLDKINRELVQKVDEYSRNDAGKVDSERERIHLIGVGFHLDSESWASIVFDTDVDANNDGRWTRSLGDSLFNIDDWSEALSQEGNIVVERLDGSEFIVEEELETHHFSELGEVIKTAVGNAGESGLFDLLRRSESCQIVIEDTNGEYGFVGKA